MSGLPTTSPLLSVYAGRECVGFILARGLAVLAVLGNVVTAFSWFGTNLLGIGLHSYGFTQTGFLWLAGFTAIQLLVTLLATAPAAPSSGGPSRHSYRCRPDVTQDEVGGKKEEVAPSSVIGS